MCLLKYVFHLCVCACVVLLYVVRVFVRQSISRVLFIYVLCSFPRCCVWFVSCVLCVRVRVVIVSRVVLV